MIGQKGSGSSLIAIGIILSFMLVFIFNNAVIGLLVGFLITVGLMVYSDMVYNETPQMVQKNRTMENKKKIVQFCKTPDEANDKLFLDKVNKAAVGFARKKHLSKPNGWCYEMAIKSYTQAVMYSCESGYPKVLKDMGIYMCYYKPIIRMVGTFNGYKHPVYLGRIFAIGVDSKTIYTINVPNYVDWLQLEKNKYYGFTREELEKTKLSDPRITMNDVLRR